MTESLKRRIGPGLLIAYGVGVMVGAGIYVLTGAVAGVAGVWAPVSFLLAAMVAAPTALAYAEFSTRFPEAAGEAAFVGAGLNSRTLAVIVGLAIVAGGSLSAGAVLRGGVGYLVHAVSVPEWAAILVLGVLLIAVAAVGVLESLSVAALFTAVELAGLGLVIWAGLSAPATPEALAPAPLHVAGVGFGAVLAFFAFIGFEDIVNMAEEVRKPNRTLPLAILAALAITTAIYAAVAWAATRAVPPALLAQSGSPLALVWQAARGGDAGFLSAIAVFAAMNGILAQIVMAARVLFGLGARSRVLAIFHHAHPRFGTPLLATLLVGVAVIALALGGEVATLAELTSSLLLTIFILVNLSLIVLKLRAPDAPRAAFHVPLAVPVLGLCLSAGALLMSIGVRP
ncbi:APC family permease [Marinibacterium profundimaris]|uniref:Amino acid permease n=1 Tax=Marinibacterium profundimaris TaxID=1679460 RepID=A0A225P1B5_9RHOB|nr:amino acid permease [Marinibacterium profundimaris]OWU77976.1 amino acid permease [Marinibacterium profundimaris]